ncbi:MAG: carboxypeptidase regulatory-like domain-containing protein [Flavobacteriales bacterium]|nr:carboxypeptidase regulatory-like domain-containing protein [Flavobacteriales bacterium]
MRSALRPLLLAALAFLLHAAVQGQKVPQRFYVKLSGVVTDHFSGDPIKGALVRLLKAGKVEAEVVTRGDGRYSLELDRGWRYSVWYSAEGLVTKHVNVDTEEVPPYPDVPFYEMDVQIALFPWIEGFDFSPFDQPLGEASYKQSVRNLSWDVEYTEQLRPKLAHAMDEYEKTYSGYYKRRAGRRPVKRTFERPDADTTKAAPLDALPQEP